MKQQFNPWLGAVIIGELFIGVVLVYALFTWLLLSSLDDSSNGSFESPMQAQVANIGIESSATITADSKPSSSSREEEPTTQVSSAASVTAGMSNGFGAPGYSSWYSFPYFNSYPFGRYTYPYRSWSASYNYRYVPPYAYPPFFSYGSIDYRYRYPSAYVSPRGYYPSVNLIPVFPYYANNPYSVTYGGPPYAQRPTTRAVAPGAKVTPVSNPTQTAVPSKPAATSTPTPNSISAQWLPELSQWPPSTNFRPAAVSSGTRYWRLVKALYCDFNDTRNGCPDLPGGGAGTSTYVILTDSSGGRTNAPLLSPSGQEQKSPGDTCDCNYAFEDSGTPIQIGGHPSDSISGLILYSVQTKLTQYHVRYFLTFQLTTR